MFTAAQSIVIGGSLLATTEVKSAFIDASGDVTSIKIGGSMIAADSPGQGGSVVVGGDLKSFTLGGSNDWRDGFRGQRAVHRQRLARHRDDQGSLIGRAADGGAKW